MTTPEPDRYLIDSMIFDKLADDEAALQVAAHLVDSGRAVFLSTHVQADEIARTPDPERVRRLLSVPVQEVPTYGFAIGYSRIGAARLSEPEPLKSLRSGNLDHTEDAMIGTTAQFEGATLVTEDRTLRGRALKQGITVIGWSELRDRLFAL